MATRPSTAPPVMLRDLIANCQRLSATLPPDNWDAATPAPHIQRRSSGTLALSPGPRPPAHIPSTRRVASAPAAAQTQTRAQRYYAGRPRSREQERAGTASALSSSASLAVHPPTPSFSRGGGNDGAYPSPSPSAVPVRVRTPPASTDGIATPARAIPRGAGSGGRQHMLGCGPRAVSTPRAAARTNGIHRPSPLRNVSMPGEGDSEIELLPRGLPSAMYELPGAREEERGRWWTGWGCCGRRK